jgi:hypothetical protein
MQMSVAEEFQASLPSQKINECFSVQYRTPKKPVIIPYLDQYFSSIDEETKKKCQVTFVNDFVPPGDGERITDVTLFLFLLVLKCNLFLTLCM